MKEFAEASQDRVKAGLATSEGEISRRELLKMASPLGKVTLDSSQCTGCGLCALECSTGALTISSDEETDFYQLLFQHNACLACNECIEVCPEQCLKLERTLEPDKLNDPPVMLFEDKVSRCRECGNVIGTRAMIDSLRIKLAATEDFPDSLLELCPLCKNRQFMISRK